VLQTALIGGNIMSEEHNNFDDNIDDFEDSKNDDVLISVSIDLLYDGMLVQDDIYDSSGDRLLIISGNTLSKDQIDRIKRLNSHGANIYVTGRTHKTMLTKRPGVGIESRSKVEEATGYARTKDETFELLREIADNKTVNMESLYIVLNELSDHFEFTPPSVIMFLINAMAPIDEYLQRHSVNVGLLNGLTGRWMGMPEDEISKLVLIGLMHDCGKVLLPPKILNAPRKLTTVEYEVVKKHVDHTYDLLSEFPEPVRLAASSHHERINGEGYAYKLSRDDVMLEARITAISDTYDAIVSQRVYQGPQSPFKTLSILDNISENGLDKDVVRIFKENIPRDLIGKPVMMSDGTIGVIRKYDLSDIEHPFVELNGRVKKTNENLYAMSLYSDD